MQNDGRVPNGSGNSSPVRQSAEERRARAASMAYGDGESLGFEISGRQTAFWLEVTAQLKGYKGSIRCPGSIQGA